MSNDISSKTNSDNINEADNGLRQQNELLVRQLKEYTEELQKEREKYKSLENKIERTHDGKFSLYNNSADLNSSRFVLSLNRENGSSNKCSSRNFSRDEKEMMNWCAFNDSYRERSNSGRNPALGKVSSRFLKYPVLDRHNMTLQNLSTTNNSFFEGDYRKDKRSINSTFDFGHRNRNNRSQIDMNLSLPHDNDVTHLSLKDLQRKDSPYISDIDDLEYSKSIIAIDKDKNNDKTNNYKKLSLQLDLSKLHTNKEVNRNNNVCNEKPKNECKTS